jgi:cell division protein FtsQ
VGLVDEQGVWMPLEKYTALNRSVKLPTLKVIGPPQHYRPYWSELYQVVIHSPVKVFQIDCQDPANLILKTELGNVHFGAYSSRFAYQLSVLDRMRQLPSYLNTSQIVYIDLKNPDSPSIQMTTINAPVKPHSS